MKNTTENHAEFRLAKNLFLNRKFSKPKSFGWIAETQNFTAELYEKRIFPEFVFNDKNLEIQRFELNIEMSKRSEK